MPLILKPGYSYAAVQSNIARLRADGVANANAVAAAHARARIAYFRRYPHGAIPAWLAWPKNYRLRAHYDRSGQPLARANPVQNLHLTARQKQDIREGLRRFGHRAGALGQAAKLYADFTGHDDLTVRKIKVNSMSAVALDIGQVTGIMYRTIRDGQVEHYIHRFSRKSRPLFAVSHDGKQLYLLGGAYDFTERGIVDRR